MPERSDERAGTSRGDHLMPENTFYYQLAYGVTIAFYLAYGLSLVVRRRALDRRRRSTRHAGATSSATSSAGTTRR